MNRPDRTLGADPPYLADRQSRDPSNLRLGGGYGAIAWAQLSGDRDRLPSQPHVDSGSTFVNSRVTKWRKTPQECDEIYQIVNQFDIFYAKIHAPYFSWLGLSSAHDVHQELAAMKRAFLHVTYETQAPTVDSTGTREGSQSLIHSLDLKQIHAKPDQLGITLAHRHPSPRI